MAADIVVPDANVILEYVYNRKYSNQAKRIVTDAINEKILMLAASLLLDEITEVLCGNLASIEQVRLHFEYLEQLSMQGAMVIVVPNTETRMKAIDIAQIGHEKAGYPEFGDSLYHAMAVLNNGIFVTNDVKHYSKVKSLGHVSLLSEY